MVKQYSLVRVGVVAAAAAAAGCAVLVVEEYETDGNNADDEGAVSYTHLTLPTKA